MTTAGGGWLQMRRQSAPARDAGNSIFFLRSNHDFIRIEHIYGVALWATPLFIMYGPKGPHYFISALLCRNKLDEYPSHRVWAAACFAAASALVTSSQGELGNAI